MSLLLTANTKLSHFRHRGGGAPRGLSGVGHAALDPAMGGDASPDTPNEDYYLSHWSRVYREDPSQLDREWHCGYDEALAAILPFVNRASAGAARRDDAGDDAGAASTSGNNNDGDGDDNVKVSANNHGLVVDVGCGSSSMGHKLWNDFSFGHLVLTDVDPGILRTMHERFGTDGDSTGDDDASSKQHHRTPRHTVRCEVADARDMPCVATSTASVVIDKGTLDALSGDNHKLAMLRECARMCDFDNGGIILSVSFAAAARVGLLARATAELGLDSNVTAVTRVVADGDPRYGHAAVFVSVIGKNLTDVELGRCELTETVLGRVARCGSVIEDEPPDSGDELTLFDEG